MALVVARWQQPQHADRDGVKYDISVSEDGNGFYKAAWSCLECCEEGLLTPVGNTPEEAMHLARICVGVHHELIHTVASCQSRDDSTL